MSGSAIRAISMGKVFRVWRRPSDMLKEALSGRQRHSEFEALRDVSFDVPGGYVVGIMGRNGAGKSTLLRIIAGTLDATSGGISVAGRISAILELGTGFHPEYTGRENVFLGGLCLGLTRKEIAARLDEIIGFAELEEFIDQPFRTYSSGMQARLSFAVATAVDPDILIIDEALAVGDARFQLKSFDRVRQFRRQGKSILLVSHDINQVVSICDHAILLEKGRVVAQGEPSVVGNIYHQLLFGPRAEEAKPPLVPNTGTRIQRAAADDPGLAISAAATSSSLSPVPAKAGDAGSVSAGYNSIHVVASVPAIHSSVATAQAGEPEVRKDPPGEQPDIFAPNGAAAEKIGPEHRYGDGAVRITDFFIKDADGRQVSTITSLKPYEFIIHLKALKHTEPLSVGVMIRTPKGIEVFGANTRLLQQLHSMVAGEKVQVRVLFRANLGHGIYFAGAAVAHDDVMHDVRFDSLQFSVETTLYHDSSLANIDARFIFEEMLESSEKLAIVNCP